MRKNIYDILKDKKIDISKEYSRLYNQFFIEEHEYKGEGIIMSMPTTICDCIEENFVSLNKELIGRCISLNDFNSSNGYNFEQYLEDISIDYLVDFAEYLSNLLKTLLVKGKITIDRKHITRLIRNVDSCMEDLGYKKIDKDGIIIFVENNPEALAVAETVNDDLSYSLIEYNHHKLKGDLQGKRAMLMQMGLDIENDRKQLKKINRELGSDLFFLLNEFIRHNNDKKYERVINDLELEEIYDDIYQMYLLAKMEMEQDDRKKRVKKIKEKINDKG